MLRKALPNDGATKRIELSEIAIKWYKRAHQSPNKAAARSGHARGGCDWDQGGSAAHLACFRVDFGSRFSAEMTLRDVKLAR